MHLLINMTADDEKNIFCKNRIYNMLKKIILANFIFLSYVVQLNASTIHIYVHDVPVRSVVEGLARSGGINLIVDDTVQGNITMYLVDVTVEEALAAIASSQNLYYDKSGYIYMITAGRKTEGGKELHTFGLSYTSAEEARKAVQAIISDTHIRCHGDTNSLVVQGNSREIAAVQSLLKKIDIPPRQVNVEVEIAALNQEAIKELGINWDWRNAEGGPGHESSFAYTAQIRALETQGKAKILAKPHMMASNGRMAKILIGDKIPILTEHLQNGQTTTTTDYTDAGIKLMYTPWIHDDGSITAHIQAEVSTPVLVTELKAYRFMTRQAETQVRIQQGKTLIIGGLIDKEDIENFRKVPILSSLPFIGRLFRSHYTSSKETEIVIMVKAEIVKD